MLGDEGQLFRTYHQRLIRATRYKVHTSRENVEDACAFAWATLLRREDIQRETAFAWLKEVARNEAVRLDRLDRASISLDPERTDAPAGNPAVTPERWEEALNRLRWLPERERRAVAMRTFGWRYADIAKELETSYTRVNQLLSAADTRLYRLAEREAAQDHPRAGRLLALEDAPPEYLRVAIGRPPKLENRRYAAQVLLREWRRAAIAIEDFRERWGVTDPIRALGAPPAESEQRRARNEARLRIERCRQERERFLGLKR